jgi:hypothetical protein
MYPFIPPLDRGDFLLGDWKLAPPLRRLLLRCRDFEAGCSSVYWKAAAAKVPAFAFADDLVLIVNGSTGRDMNMIVGTSKTLKTCEGCLPCSPCRRR